MPARVRKKKSGCYGVSTPRKVHAFCSTHRNAERQARLLDAYDHGMAPARTGKRRNRGRAR